MQTGSRQQFTLRSKKESFAAVALKLEGHAAFGRHIGAASARTDRQSRYSMTFWGLLMRLCCQHQNDLSRSDSYMRAQGATLRRRSASDHVGKRIGFHQA